MKKTNKNKGFTLIEVLISIVIVGIMSAVTVVSYKGYIGQTNEAATKQELNQVAQAYEVGALDGKFDPSQAAYSYEQLKTVYYGITGYVLPYSNTEISYANSVLTLTRRSVAVAYDFSTKTVTVK